MRFIGAIAALLLLLGTVSSAPVGRSMASPENESCITCHVQVYNEGIQSAFVHLPFWEQQCVQCHLAGGAVSETTEPESITGTVVTQENLWRKLMTFRESGVEKIEHRITCPSLEMDKGYRFRIVVSGPEGSDRPEEHRSLWLGLEPRELYEPGGSAGMEITTGLSTSIGEQVRSLNLYCPDGATVFVSWKTLEPFIGWVELQELEGPDFGVPETAGSSLKLAEEESAAAGASPHANLRDPEELAIDLCNDCHSMAGLGTSHPVRIYGGHETRIPEDLPTVNGLLTCVTCHDPHGASGKNLVREKIKTKLCVACHYNFKNRSLSTMFD